jgi:glyceraldehyde 3-phosphate dehydrogenase
VQTVGDSQLVRVVSWYDNEMSYVYQLVRTVKYFAGLIDK